ncbi:hypothetical protein EVAR_12294_1 [Eumeta japonica]|uniref:Uncharacterized protein n=1 Tax=Eumeta variegata TaxID=151549 RepID=A0A4C1TU89_EUMVA|nr:hypothetical protein EVAR_12294_1 [Eumeta japonica]
MVRCQPQTGRWVSKKDLMSSRSEMNSLWEAETQLPGDLHNGGATTGVHSMGKKKKKLKKLLPILALLKLKFAAMIPLFLGIIAFAVFKAYLLGKIAFIAAAFGSLKKLLDAKKSSGWSEPVHEEHGWESGGGWGRASIQNAQDLAYSGHIKQS